MDTYGWVSIQPSQPKQAFFFGPGHHGLEDVSIQLIDRVSGEESALRDKEGQWAYRLNCIQPQGLNISDFFYSQNRSTRSRVR